MKYNLSQIMKKAWELFRKAEITFSEALHRAWLSAKAIEINQNRIELEWKKLGYEVIHGSKALFGADLIWGSKGDGAIYKARFFGRSQVQEVAA